MDKNVVLSLQGIGKSFPGVRALDGVSVDFYEGEVHSIVGENGAGKSTLMKILSGVYSLDEGKIFINGAQEKIKSPLDALNKGQSIIFQEFNLINALSITENIFLGRLSNDNGLWIDWKTANRKAAELMKQVGYDVDPTMLIKDLSVAQKQMVEIAKALSYHSKIIIMDEPSATLTSTEAENLFKIIDDLRKEHVTVLYISHKLEEVLRISDRVSVMRDGHLISTRNVADVTQKLIIEDMVGRTVDQEYPRRQALAIDNVEVVLEAKNLNRRNAFHDISFQLKKGEVLGLAGLVGSGRTEIVRAIFGADKLESGALFIKGKKVKVTSPRDSIKNGLALLTEDRKQQGLLLQMALSKNTSAANLGVLTKFGFLNRKEEKRVCKNYIDVLSIKTPSSEQRAIHLSGGNQQKVVLAKWLYANCDIIILDEPTRGIDVGAKMEIYNLINSLIAEGKSIIIISSELPELLAMSDRVLVIYEGRVRGELTGDEISAENVMQTILRK
ncbi:MAG: sugar ABC transporter ATP-binding protein [Clostridia bacterium]